MLILSCGYPQNGSKPLLQHSNATGDVLRAFETQPDPNHSSLSEICAALFIFNFIILDQQYAVRLPAQAYDFHSTVIPCIIVWALN